MTMRRWVDWVNVIFGVWLIASSGLLTLAASHAAAWSACSAGIALVMLAGLAMTRSAIWLDALGVMVGAWLMLSTWAIHFVSSSASTNAFIVGVLVIAYALWAMRLDITTSTNARTAARGAMRPVRR